MIIRPDEDPSWKICKNLECIKTYLKTNNDTQCKCKCSVEEAEFVDVIQNTYYCKDGVVILRQSVTRSEVNEHKDIELGKKSECIYYDIISYISDKYINVLPCVECGARPQLRIDKATGKFYCTCPSSFYGDDEEIGDIDENDPDKWISISKDTPLYDTMVEAIDVWNECNSYEFLKSEIEKLVKEIKSYDEFSAKFDEIVFAHWIHTETDKIKKLLNLCNYFYNINAHEFEFFLYNDFEDYDAVKQTYNELIENLKKIIYFQYEYRSKLTPILN